MSRRTWTLLLLVYVSLDLSSPFVPGAFNFDPDDCVEGLHRPIDGRAHNKNGDVRAAPVVPAVPGKRPLVAGPAILEHCLVPRHVISDWLIDLRRSHPPSRDGGSPSEDH
ncbi:MAG TPA: hypothetical protein VFU40_13465 [Gemmatimonadales bacterium]|nr:hypothetical protein [Gemmatimonadales bacterium]